MKKFLNSLLAICLLVMLFPQPTLAVSSGVCGKNANWTLDSTGCLTVSGLGSIYGGDVLSTNPDWTNNKNSITSVVIQTGIDGIGDHAFDNCSNLTSVEISESVTNVGYAVFEGCDKLQEINVAANNPKYYSNDGILFYHYTYDGNRIDVLDIYPCGRLTSSYAIPNGVTYIYGFRDCRNLEYISIPDTVTYIGAAAFDGCTSLKSIRIPDSVTGVGFDAFRGCSSLSSVTLPNKLDYIEWDTFSDCIALTKIAIPSSVSEIESFAFYGCNKLKDIYYAGSQAQWSAIQIDDYNEPLFKATVHYNSMAGMEISPSDSAEPIQPSTNTFQFSLSRTYIAIVEGQSLRPPYTLSPSNAKVIWTSLNPDLLSVGSDGTITAIKEGATRVAGVATLGDQTIDVSYSVSIISQTSILFKDRNINLGVGSSTRLGYTSRPIAADVQFSSSNPSVVSVSGNTVQALSSGTATITATASFDGRTATDTCTVIVGRTDTEKAQAFVNEALKYIGYTEIQFEQAVGKAVNNNAWCADFVSICAERVGAEKAIPYNASAPGMIQTIQNAGGMRIEVSEKPQIGDIVGIDSFHYGRTTHVGIICGMDDKYAYVVHGNWWHRSESGEVCAPTEFGDDYRHNSTCGKFLLSGEWSSAGGAIICYIRPDWSKVEGANTGSRTDVYRCPIEVSYSYNGEILDSLTGQLEASFGTMKLTEHGEIEVSLNDYYDVDVEVTGYDAGNMSVTSTFKDNDGSVYSRTFKDIPITADTVINVFAYDGIASEWMTIYRKGGEEFIEAWSANNGESVTTANQELTDLFINGDGGGDVIPNNIINVTVNNIAVAWTDATPFIDENDRTMVPLRAVADALGLNVDWDANNREAVFTDGTKTIYFPIGSTSARTSDGEVVEMDTAAVIVNDRTFAPIRYLAECFGYTVGWNGETRTVFIETLS